MLQITHTPEMTHGHERENLKNKPIMARNLQALGLYAYAIEMIKAKNFERLKEVENL